MLDILEGPQQGRKVFDQLSLVNANPTTVEIAQRTLSATCRSTGSLRLPRSQSRFADCNAHCGRVFQMGDANLSRHE